MNQILRYFTYYTKLKILFFQEADVADFVIGKAAALRKVGSIYARLISEHAIKVLDKYQIPYE